jgi:hypothetical protein
MDSLGNSVCHLILSDEVQSNTRLSIAYKSAKVYISGFDFALFLRRWNSM